MSPTEPARFRPRQYPPPQFPPARPARFSRTPPAIFPPILGLLGLGLALRHASAALDLPASAAEMLLGATTALWLLALFAYGVKVMRRPAVVAEDLRVLPGRAGLAVAGLSMLLVAAAAVPYAPGLARGVLFGGLALHTLIVALIIRQMVLGPYDLRQVTPVWHLSFVGFIVGGLAAVPPPHPARPAAPAAGDPSQPGGAVCHRRGRAWAHRPGPWFCRPRGADPDRPGGGCALADGLGLHPVLGGLHLSDCGLCQRALRAWA